MPRSRTQLDRTGEPYVDWVKTANSRLRVNIKCRAPDLPYIINVVGHVKTEEGEIVAQADHEQIRFDPDVTSRTIQFRIKSEASELRLTPVVPLDSSSNEDDVHFEEREEYTLLLIILDAKHAHQEYDKASIDITLDGSEIMTGEVSDAENK